MKRKISYWFLVFDSVAFLTNNIITFGLFIVPLIGQPSVENVSVCGAGFGPNPTNNKSTIADTRPMTAP